MPQQFHQAEDAAAVPVQASVTPEASSAAAPASAADLSRRYDTATVQQIIALAEQMQTRHRETLSPEEVENLGREVGVEPEFVRRALAQLDAAAAQEKQAAPVVLTDGQRRRRIGIRRHSLTRKQKAVVLLPTALYLLLMPITFSWFNVGGSGLIWLYIVLPAVLAFCVGVNGKSKRVGALGGGAFGLASLATLMLNAAFHHWPQPPPGQLIALLAGWLAAGGTLGTGGAALRQGLDGFRRKRLRVRVVVEQTEDEKQNDDWV